MFLWKGKVAHGRIVEFALKVRGIARKVNVICTQDCNRVTKAVLFVTSL